MPINTDVLDAEPETGFFAGFYNSMAKSYNLLTPSDQPKVPVAETKGLGAGIGALFNPFNLALGVVGGEALGAGAELAENVANVAVPAIAKSAGIGAIEGTGYTLLDHYENKASKINDQLTFGNIASGALFGGVLGAGFGAVGQYFGRGISKATEAGENATQSDLEPNMTGKPNSQDVAQLQSKVTPNEDYGQVVNNPDAKLGSITVANGYEYNPQNMMGYNLTEDMPEPTPELPKYNDNTLYSTFAQDIKDGRFSDDSLPKDEQYINDFLEKHKNNLAQAKALNDAGVNLKDLPQRIENIRNEIEADFSQKFIEADKNIVDELYDFTSDAPIRNGLYGDISGLNDTQAQSVKFYNSMNHDLITTAQKEGIDIGEIEGYVRQDHNPDAMLLSSADEWANFIKPLLANDMDLESLRKSYYKITTSDIGDIFAPKSMSSPLQSRTLHFKDAESQRLYQEKYGYGSNQLLGNHLIDNIQRMAKKISVARVLGSDAPLDVVKFLGRMQSKPGRDIKNTIETLQALRLQPESNALSTAVSGLSTLNKFVNGVFHPAYMVAHVGTDFFNALVHSWQNFGAWNTLKSLFASKPTKDIAYLANLPFEERENWKNIFNGLKETARQTAIDDMGVKLSNNLRPTLRFMQRGYMKYMGMHWLDKNLRNFMTKLTAESLKNLGTAGIKKMYPNLDENILELAKNSKGYFVPKQLDNLIDTSTNLTKDEIRQYKITSDTLKNIYANMNNDINPIYSAKFAKARRFDPAFTAGARTLFWSLSMYRGVYGKMLRDFMGGNKIQALSHVAAATLGLGAIETATDHVINMLEGNKEKDLNKEFGSNVAKSLIPVASFNQAPLVYGSLPNVFRAGRYEMSGDEAKAKNTIMKAVPLAKIVTNLWATHTAEDDAEFRRNIRAQ